MNKTTRIIIVVAVVTVAALAFIAKQSKSTSPTVPLGADAMAATEQSPGANAAVVPVAVAKVKQPRLVDLGAGKCIPCKMMKPILDDLKANYTDHFSTEFIDVWENPDAGVLQHLGVGSLVYVVLLSGFLWLLVRPLDARTRYFGTLTYVTLTAPPGLLYALPVRAWLDVGAAQEIRLWFLVGVAAWRVALGR